jgi:DNA-binding NtrC family response regulator
MELSTVEKNNSNTKRILLFDLDRAQGSELERVLTSQNLVVHSERSLPLTQCLRLVEEYRADLIFCPAQRAHYKKLLDALGERRPGLPVIVVSPYPEVAEWLDAIEAGASDYCTPPFDAAQIAWILETAFKSRSVAA